jgi:Nucleotidyltransferase/DNA polymerase involved in DNA repair
MEKIVFHVDVNSAFLSWDAVYRLKHLGGTKDLREQVSAVGGDVTMRHGIILAKSIPAKKYGIQTGESILEAKQKCPELILVPPNYGLYEKSSVAFMNILREYTPDVEQYSIDEAFMDMTGTERLWGSPVTVANMIKDRIYNELGFTVNIGVSNNKLLAKMAGDFKKPNWFIPCFRKR